ncbi:ribonuclease H [archaeon SCG-AAA382B04]|nr:ribonuclease H [archaeon SCG-AAA382B04]
MKLYFDGACEPKNPGGHGTYGFVVKEDDKIVKEGSDYLGKGDGITNNVAEYTALIEGLKYLRDNCSDSKIKVYGDSQLVIRQMTGQYAVRSERIKPLWKEAKDIAKEMNTFYQWVPREQNEEADALAVQEYEDKAFPKRKKKAKEEDMSVEKIDTSTFKVKDKYVVDIDEGTCTCPDHQTRGVKCKHIFKVEMEC